MLLGAVLPRPFGGLVIERQMGARRARAFDPPRRQPALAMKRVGVARHVRSDRHPAVAEGELAAADAVDIGDERKAGGFQDIFMASVAFAQYRRPLFAINPFERRNTPAYRRVYTEFQDARGQRDRSVGTHFCTSDFQTIHKPATSLGINPD